MQIEQEVAPIAQGYEYAFRLRVTGGSGPAFPAGCVIHAQVRPYPEAPVAAGLLTTADGSLLRIDASTIEVRMPGALTEMIFNDVAHLDFVRVDLSPAIWLGVQVELPVVVPVTKPD